MPKFFFATLFFFINVIVSQAQTPDVYAEQTFKGKIDNQYEIELTINKFIHTEDETVNLFNLVGSYVYTSTQKPIKLSGFAFFMEQTFQLESKKVIDGKEVTDETFSGTYDEKTHTLKGTWTKVSKNKSAPFELKKVLHPHRQTFLKFIKFYHALEDRSTPFVYTEDNFDASLDWDMPCIKGLGFSGSSSLYGISYFEEDRLAYDYGREKMNGEDIYSTALYVLSGSKCTILELFIGGSSSFSDEGEDENGNTVSTESLEQSAYASVWQWNGSKFEDITAQVFPKSAKVSFSLSENANNWDLVNSYVENDTFVIGADNNNAIKWRWDGQQFNEVK